MLSRVNFAPCIFMQLVKEKTEGEGENMSEKQEQKNEDIREFGQVALNNNRENNGSHF